MSKKGVICPHCSGANIVDETTLSTRCSYCDEIINVKRKENKTVIVVTGSFLIAVCFIFMIISLANPSVSLTSNKVDVINNIYYEKTTQTTNVYSNIVKGTGIDYGDVDLNNYVRVSIPEEFTPSTYNSNSVYQYYYYPEGLSKTYFILTTIPECNSISDFYNKYLASYTTTKEAEVTVTNIGNMFWYTYEYQSLANYNVIESVTMIDGYVLNLSFGYDTSTEENIINSKTYYNNIIDSINFK